ncbi:MAG: DUF342 domain-containing protein [Ignavibacteriae bacterium]|nr:DUF342 domain-containing protein [Ignavibacteriota bacterium]
MSDVNVEKSKSTFQKAKLFVKPLSEELTSKIPPTLQGSKIYLTRLDVPFEQLNVVKKSSILFRYIIDENASDTENEKSDLISEINPDFHDSKSSIEQLGKDYIASEDGLFIIENHRPKIIPISLDGSGDVKISEDTMKVLVDIYPSIDDHPITSLEDIVNKIISLNVTSEINKNLLSEKLEFVKNDKHILKDICVSEGKFPVNGIDGKLENCTANKEKLQNLNCDEFHKTNPIISVKAEELIAIIHQPTNGENGINVFGKNVNPIPGKEVKIKLGSNTKFSDENPNHIISKLDGFLELKEESISITDTFMVNGDIDFKSGNIISKGALKVKGNVNNDFTLNLSKDIEVDGYVGDAILESGKNIIVHGGFLGKGKGILKADGDIEVKFVENQKVFSRGSVTVYKELLNAQVFAKSKITCKGNKAVIVGGQTIAGDAIDIYTLGNSSESETIVEVGFDYLKRNSIIDNKACQAELRKKLEGVDKVLFEFAQMKRLNDQCKEKVKVFVAEHKNLIAEIDKLKEINLKLTNEIYVPTSSKISVTGTIYPGVKIGINGRFFIVKEMMRSKTFVLSADNEVIAI